MSAVMDRQEWLAERKNYLGGSDMAAILGLSPWRTPLDVYIEKTGDAEPWEGNAATYWGNRLEDIVAQEYARRSGHRVRRVNKTIAHPDYPFLRANLDREVVGKRWVLECKTAGLRSADHWGEDGTDEVPDYYLPQVAHYMAIRKAPRAEVAVLIGGQDYRVFHVPVDPSLERLLIAEGVRFWREHVEAGIPPAPTNADDVLKLFPRDDGKEIPADPEVIDAVDVLRRVKVELGQLEQAKEDAENLIKTYLGEHSILRGPDGKPLATWKAAKDSPRFDAKRFRAENPDLAAKYTKTVPGSRRFLLK